jgi:hypothetical protein
MSHAVVLVLVATGLLWHGECSPMAHIQGPTVHARVREDQMAVIVSMDNAGEVVVASPQGHLIAEGFFKAEDETPEELQQMGYRPLVTLYAPAQILVGRGVEPEDLADVFIEA